MLSPGGYGVETIEGKIVREVDSYTCKHCGRVSFLRPKQPPYATCKQCMGFICVGCYHDLTRGTGVCKPMEQWLLDQERGINDSIERRRRLAEYEHHLSRF